MEKEKLLEQIQINKLENLEYNFLISQLCVLNNKAFEVMQKEVDQLIMEKKINVVGAPINLIQPKVEKKPDKLDYMKYAKKKNKKQ